MISIFVKKIGLLSTGSIIDQPYYNKVYILWFDKDYVHIWWLLGNIAICPYVPLTDSLIDFFYYKINLINQTTKDNIMLKIAIYYWPIPSSDPQGIRVASVFEISVCVFVLGKFSNYSPHPPLFPSFIVLSPLSPLLFISKIFSVMIKNETSWEWIPMYGPLGGLWTVGGITIYRKTHHMIFSFNIFISLQDTSEMH